jgi:hypothetical protein
MSCEYHHHRFDKIWLNSLYVVWYAFRYVSPSQAERAIARNGAFLSNHIMIGVQSMNARKAKDMNVSIQSDGRMVHRGAALGNMSREGAEGVAAR